MRDSCDINHLEKMCDEDQRLAKISHISCEKKTDNQENSKICNGNRGYFDKVRKKMIRKI